MSTHIAEAEELPNRWKEACSETIAKVVKQPRPCFRAKTVLIKLWNGDYFTFPQHNTISRRVWKGFQTSL